MAQDLEFRLYGDWDKAQKFLGNLPRIMDEVAHRVAVKTGLMGEAIAKRYLGGQSLNWTPLAEKSLKAKKRKGHSDAILIATSSYFQAITTWNDKDGAYVGVKRTAKNRDGEVIANIAAVHEYGSLVRGIPARPLWQPTLDQLTKDVKSQDPFRKELERRAAYYGLTVK